MAIQLFCDLSKIICSPFSDPQKNPTKVEENIIRLTACYTLFAGSSAVLLVILKERSLSTWTFSLLKFSLITGATSAAILVCTAYNYKRNKSSKENILRFERAICHASVGGDIAIIMAHSLFNGNKYVMPIAEYCNNHFYIPLLLCGITAMAIECYHVNQINRAEKANQ